MDYKNIISLIKEMNQTDLTKLEIEEEGIRICIEKAAKKELTIEKEQLSQLSLYPPVHYLPQNYAVAGIQPQAAPAAMQNMVSAQTAVESQAQAAQAENSVSQSEECYKKQVSPMVGTFYSKPSPDKPAFVKVGDKVRKGQTICIIEAMKLMNEIECEHDGEVVEILVKNEAMVEYGQPLLLIK